MSKEIAIDFHASCQEEPDGTLTILLHVSGLPDIDTANRVSNWLRDTLRENAHKIGRRGVPPTQQ